MEQGADIDARSFDGETPLMTAIKRGHINIVKDLVDAGADLNATDGNGLTAKNWAEDSNNQSILKFLDEATKK